MYDSGDALRENASPEKLLLTNEIKEVVFKTIEQLPEDLRTAINLRELEGLSYEEIATVMDCPVGTVRSRIFRARDAVDKKIKPFFTTHATKPKQFTVATVEITLYLLL